MNEVRVGSSKDLVTATDELRRMLDERIVRCRDCKHATPDTSGRKRYKGYLWCDKLTDGIGFSVAPSDFCAWGERKEVDE